MENATRAQQRLVANGFAIEVDGGFGAQSIAALMCFVGQKTTVSLIRQQLGQAAAKYFPTVGITSALRTAHALAQQSVETGGFSTLVEGFNYSVAGLRGTFGKSRISDADCQRLGRQPGESVVPISRQIDIANVVYGGSFGLTNLGNTHPGDGSKYRGRGVKQTTGLHNYAQVANLTGVDVVANPVLLEDPDMGVRAGCIFWDTHGCNAIADTDNIGALTLKINGGSNGLPERTAALARAKQILL